MPSITRSLATGLLKVCLGNRQRPMGLTTPGADRTPALGQECPVDSDTETNFQGAQMRKKVRNTGVLAVLWLLAPMLAAGCGLPGHAPRRPTPEDEVSVGYGTRSRKDVAASISSASPERLDGRSILRVQDLLEGIPGLQVLPLSRGDFTVRIRGMGTGLGSAEPLLVIDDVTVQAGTVGSTLATVPPQEIVRIDVLKDASSTAVYGVRGANGVIIVTTKRSR